MEAFDLKEFTIVIDSRSITKPETLFVALRGAKDGHQFVNDAAARGARYALVERGFTTTAPITLIHVDNTLHALQELAARHRKTLKAKVIAIIGSQGKTQAKDCLKQVLQKKFKTFSSPESFNSQLGVALSLLQCKPHHEIALIEAAISHPGEMARLEAMIAPDAVIITSLTVKHRRTLGARQAEEMMAMTANLKGFCLVPPDFPYPGTHWDRAPSIKVPHPYPHVDQTLALSYKAAQLLGLDEETIIAGLKEFDPIPQHTEIWSSSWGATFINAPHCQSALALTKGLRKLEHLAHRGKRYILFFGMDGELRTDEITAARIDKVYFIGERSSLNLSCEKAFFASKNDACRALYEELGRDDTVLLIGSEKHHLDELVFALMDMLGESRLSIDLGAIEHNVNEIRAHNPSSRIMVMLKAFGYGTDNLLLAKFLSTFGIDIFGVAHVDEAILLRRKGVKGSFFIINVAPHEAEKAALWDCEVGLSSFTLLEALEKAASLHKKKMRVHLHVDTGMGRFGCRPEEALPLALKVASSPHLLLEGLMTHFACADMPTEDDFTAKQIAAFKGVLQALALNGLKPRYVHACNSSATVRSLFPEGNMIRLGLALFGLKNSSSMPSIPTLRCALSLTTKIAGINVLKQGETLSYGKTYTETRPESKIAILPLGYFDGLHRHYSGKSALAIAGKLAPMVGRICMDFMMIDISHLPSTQMGDEVLVFGTDSSGHFLPPEALAETGGTIAHELITCLGPRIQRLFIDTEH